MDSLSVELPSLTTTYLPPSSPMGAGGMQKLFISGPD